VNLPPGTNDAITRAQLIVWASGEKKPAGGTRDGLWDQSVRLSESEPHDRTVRPRRSQRYAVCAERNKVSHELERQLRGPAADRTAGRAHSKRSPIAAPTSWRCRAGAAALAGSSGSGIKSTNPFELWMQFAQQWQNVWTGTRKQGPLTLED